MNKPDKMIENYRAASKAVRSDPEELKAGACLAMGFLLGAGLEGAAASVARLYAEKYGEDNWPTHVAQLEQE